MEPKCDGCDARKQLMRNYGGHCSESFTPSGGWRTIDYEIWEKGLSPMWCPKRNEKLKEGE